MSDFYKQFETPLDRAVDKAIRQANDAFLASPEAQAEAERVGTLWRRYFDATALGFEQRRDEDGYPTETLEEFCQRAGV